MKQGPLGLVGLILQCLSFSQGKVMFVYVKSGENQFSIYKIVNDSLVLVSDVSLSDLNITKNVLKNDIVPMEKYEEKLKERHQQLLKSRKSDDYSSYFGIYWGLVHDRCKTYNESNLKILSNFNKFW